MKTHYIPENQFPLKLSDNIFVLGNYFFNLFLITGKKKTALFETGISGIVDSVIRQIEDIGKKPDYIIVSHPHSDHITGLPGLKERYPKARVIAGDGADGFINHPKAGPALLKEDAFMSQSIEGLFGIKTGRPPLDKIPDLTGANLIAGKKELDLGCVTFELSPISGHSPANLIGYVKQDRVLLCSDSLGFHFPGRGFLPLFFTGAGPYRSGLERIETYNPETICPAHQGPLVKKAAVDGLKDAIITTDRLIHHIQSCQKPDDVLTQELFNNYYKDEFTLYTQQNILNCCALLVKRARQVYPSS